MGSHAHLIVVGGRPGLIDQARERVDALEGLWSRFRPGSEVTALNNRAGAAVAVSPETALLVRRAVEGWRLTGGRYDPTLLGAIIRAGYDRPFDQLPNRVGARRSSLTNGAGQIQITPATIRLPVGVGFDPGGIGKGLAADIVCAETLSAGAEGVCVNLGGDVCVRGMPPDGQAWTIAIEHPWSPAPIALVGLRDGAVATSTTLRRRWQVNETNRHHLLDPTTDSPTRSDLNLATVINADAWLAEVMAKAVLLKGLAGSLGGLAGTGSQGLTVNHGGRVQTTAGFQAFLGEPPLPVAIREDALGELNRSPTSTWI